MLEKLWAILSDLVTVTAAALAIGLMVGVGFAGVNVWPGIALGVSLTVTILTFIWGMNRYAGWRSLRFLMGGICGIGSWATVIWAVIGTAVGLEMPVKLVSEWPWGFSDPEKEAELEEITVASLPKAVVDDVLRVEKAIEEAQNPNWTHAAL